MSEFWKRKMRTYFDTFDFNKDGFITEDEYVGMGHRLAEKLNADPEQKEKVIQSLTNVWKRYLISGTAQKANRLTVEIFTESLSQQRYDPDLIMALVALYRSIFDVLDVNKDGFLQPEEHKRIFDSMGFPEGRFDRKMAFDALDTNRDGIISYNEYISGAFDFFFSEDESSPRKLFFGPLVD